MKSRKVEIVPYSSQWPEYFEAESLKIQQALGNNCVIIHHIGSTSIEGLSAKPIIDMIPVVQDITKVDKQNHQMLQLGYDCLGESGLAFRRFFTKRDVGIGFNVHVHEIGSTEITRHLNFRNWLRGNENDKKDYEDLKHRLAIQYPFDIYNYCMGKDEWVAKLDKKAGFTGYKMVIALMDKEWSYFKDAHIENNLNPMFDKITFDENAKQRFFPFVLYKGDALIGAALIEFISHDSAKLHSICLSHTTHLKESDFYKLLIKWSRQHDKELVD